MVVKRIRKSLLGGISFLLLFLSCTENENVVNQDPEQNDSGIICLDCPDPDRQNLNFIPLEEALKTADAFFAEVDRPDTKLRTSTRRVVKSVKSLNTIPTTRMRSSEMEDLSTSLYLVNYDNKEGFALLASDTRLCPIYAISDEGELDFADTLYNKGLAAFVDAVTADIAYTAASNPTLEDHYKEGNAIIKPQVEPLLGLGASRWDQRYPYNTYCFTASGQQALVGCTAVAIGQIMSFYEWPQYVGNERLTWRTMKKIENTDDAALLLAKLGEPALLDMNYGTSVSIALQKNQQRTFMGMGYKKPDDFKSFSESAVRKILDTYLNGVTFKTGEGPVLMSAAQKDMDIGHSWVIDGYARNVISTNSTPVDYNTTLFHCVWGWKGSCNGYFYWGNDQSFSGRPIAYDRSDDFDHESLNYNFNWDIKYMTNFIPNN